jgi:hypothetical protein
LARAGPYDTPTPQPNQENQAAITVSVDTTTVKLGDDLVITYTVAPSTASFDNVTVQIKNSADTVVAEWTSQPGSSGPHSVTWQKAKWNTVSHSGAYANPANGSYTVWALGYKANQATDNDSTTVSTKLVVEFDVRDYPPANTGDQFTRVAGLSDMGSVLQVVFQQGSYTDPNPPTEVTFSGNDLTISDGPTPDNNPPMKVQKHVKIDVAGLNSLGNGAYTVELLNLRDDIGNFTDADNDPSNGVQPVSYNLDLE